MIEWLFQVLGEFLLQALGELLLELGLHAIAEPFQREPNPWLLALGYALLGAMVGGLSLLVVPQHLAPPGLWRVLNLLCTPLAVGLGMSALGHWRSRRGQPLFAIDRFACGYLFALMLALVRFRFAG